MSEPKENYKRGMMRGIWLYAHWHDGVQLVGSCGKTLDQALREVDEDVEKYFGPDHALTTEEMWG